MRFVHHQRRSNAPKSKSIGKTSTKSTMSNEAAALRNKPSDGPRKPSTPFAVKPLNAFYVFLAANILGAAYGPIQDCDETFNYWEPTHYLSHGYGLQTWEYSPEYAIRSWTYAALHGIIGSLRRLLPFPSKVQEFYFIRYVLAVTCAICQTRLFQVISGILNPRIALFFMMAMVFSPGMFHASSAYLPSSFAMCATMLGTAAFMHWTKESLSTARGIFWFAVGGILGWPFSLALSIPFICEEFILASLSGMAAVMGLSSRVARGFGAALLVLLFEMLVSGLFFRKITVVPLNLLLYNVFSGNGRGPEIFGTDPWHFYLRNLLLNFNIWFVLAIAALPLFIVQKLSSRRLGEGGSITGLRTLVFLSPFYIWLAIFSFQPHKEERFMYPAYPFLALNAAMGLHIILAAFGNSNPTSIIGRIPVQVKLLIVSIFIIGSIDIGLARIYGMYTAYSAPLKVYDVLRNGKHGRSGDVVCFGKDWYRFPTSYFLPDGMEARFISSEFQGLLPGQFARGQASQGFRPGTWITPTGMNDRNQFDDSKVIDISACDFLVDTNFSESQASALEPQYQLDVERWEAISCAPFLDNRKTRALGRLMWLPDLPFVPTEWRRRWGEHCVLRRKRPKGSEM